MALWSLTQERVEKLRKQIGDQEIEIDTLLKKTKEDLWKADLDDFINEWRFQLDDEAKRRKKARQMGRRASQKLKIGAAGPKKRKAGYGSDESDFGVSKAKKPAAAKPPKPKAGGLLSEPLAKANQPKPRGRPKPAAQVKPQTKPEDDVWMDLGLADATTTKAPIAPIFQKTKAAAAASKPPVPAEHTISDDEDDDSDEVIRKPAARKPRAAASKPITYGLEADSDDSGDGMLFDVGKMVKGINGASTDSNPRALFSNTTSTSRPGSSHGLPKKASSASARQNDFDGADDTDYSKLAPPTTKKGPAVTARNTVLSDEEDDSFDVMMTVAAASQPAAPKPAAKKGVSKATKPEVSKPSKTSKPAASKTVETKAPTVNKAAAAPVAAPPKKLPLSPAAKAYAAKQARKNKVVQDDSSEEEDAVEKVANEIMEDDDDEDDADDVPAARRPARRAAASAPKKNWVVASGSEEDEEEESAMFEGEDSDDY